MNTKMIEVEVLRYRPEQDEKPFHQVYQVPYKQHWSILEALQYIKDNLDDSVSFRWSCRMAICGSCGMMVNGAPKLACKTFLRDFYPNRVSVAPLENFPIERDLIPVVDSVIGKMKEAKTYLIAKQAKVVADGSSKQTPTQLERYRQYSMCINCLLCYAACSQFGLDNNFAGPAILTLVQRYATDSRDAGIEERIGFVSEESGVWGCTFMGECSRVCPKNVDPAAAVQQLKLSVTLDYAVSIFKPSKNKQQA